MQLTIKKVSVFHSTLSTSQMNVPFYLRK